MLSAHNEAILLEQLPVFILARIFDLLSTTDLLNVCVASKYFYLPAVIRLYRRIIITNELLVSYARQFLTDWDSNYGTAIVASSTSKLLEVIAENDKLALLVHSIIVTETESVPHMEEILLVTNVKELYYVCDLKLPQKLLNNVLKLTVPVRVPLIALKVTELRFCNLSHDANPDMYHMLALTMLENELYHNLRTLAFEITEDRNLRKLNQLNTETQRPVAGWIQFFAAFALLNTRLQITDLTLEGHVKDIGYRIAALLNEAIDLPQLHLLSLLCSELSHAHVPHYDNSSTLLENLTKHTCALAQLAICPTDDCLTCQVSAITNTLLSNLARQLEDLLVVFESPNLATADSVRMVIVEHQRNLKRLRFREKTTQGGLKSELYHQLDQQLMTDWEHGAYYTHRIRRDFFPTTTQFARRMMSDPFVRCLEANRAKIASVLTKDLVLQNAEKLPKLEEYELIDFTLSVKNMAFMVNGREIPFESRD